MLPTTNRTVADNDLPDLLARVARACGRATALALAKEFGGVVVDVPKKPSPHHKLVRAIGIEATEKLIDLFGNGPLTVPLGPFKSQAKAREATRQNLRAGMSTMKTARAVGIHERTVRRVRRKLVAG